jgi:ATP-dependent Clp protease protease subunit
MIHQGSGGFRGNTPDVFIQVKEMETLVNTNHQILSRHTGQPIEKIVADTSRDYFMSPTEAKDYGIIDAVYSATSESVKAKLRAVDAPDEGVKPADDGQALRAETDRT